MLNLVAAVKGSSTSSNNVRFYFVNDDKLVNSIYEFGLNSSSGEIILKQNLNRNVSKLRELTLAANLESTSQFDQQIVSYQYLCINIAVASNFQPCFKKSVINEKIKNL